MVLLFGQLVRFDALDTEEILESLPNTLIPARKLARHGIDHLLYQTKEGAGIVIAGKPGTIGADAILAHPHFLAGWYHDKTPRGFLYQENEQGLLVQPKPGTVVPALTIDGDITHKPFLNTNLRTLLALGTHDLDYEMRHKRSIAPSEIEQRIRSYDPLLRK